MAALMTPRRLLIVLGVGAVAGAAAYLAFGRDPEQASEPPSGPPAADTDVASQRGFRFELIQGRCGYSNVVTAGETILSDEGEFCLVTADITYDGEEPASLDGSCQFLVDGDGRRHRMRLDVVGLDVGSTPAFEEPFEPGGVVEDVGFYYDVPSGTDARFLELHAACGSPGVRLALDPALQGAET